MVLVLLRHAQENAATSAKVGTINAIRDGTYDLELLIEILVAHCESGQGPGSSRVAVPNGVEMDVAVVVR